MEGDEQSERRYRMANGREQCSECYTIVNIAALDIVDGEFLCRDCKEDR